MRNFLANLILTTYFKTNSVANSLFFIYRHIRSFITWTRLIITNINYFSSDIYYNLLPEFSKKFKIILYLGPSRI